MSNFFSSCHIILEDNKRTLELIELDYSPEDLLFKLKILNKSGTILFDEVVFDYSTIRIDIKEEIVTLVYVDVSTDEVLKERELVLRDFHVSEDVVQQIRTEKIEKNNYKRLAEMVKTKLDNPEGSSSEVENHTQMINRATMDIKARYYVENKIKQILQNDEYVSQELIEKYTCMIYAQFYGMGVLQELDDDVSIGEIMVNGFVHPEFRCDIYYIKNGKKYLHNKTFSNLEELKQVYSRAIAFSRKELNSLENALIEATRSNRDRVNIVIPDASESWALNIRKFGNFVPSSNSMKDYGTVNDGIEELLQILVRGKANIGIGGEMGTGKTSFINYLLTFTEKSERKCVIASVSETDVDRVLKGHDVLVFNVDETKGFTFSKLIRASLRTTSDRVIIPESRGEEFRQVYEANLKTKGNMFTAHALTDYEFLDMCVDMYNGDNSTSNVDSVRNKIAKAVDVIIIKRRVGNKIRIKSISEVVLNPVTKVFERMNPLWIWVSDPEDNTKGYYQRTENKITENLKSRLNEYGVPMSVMETL